MLYNFRKSFGRFLLACVGAGATTTSVLATWSCGQESAFKPIDFSKAGAQLRSISNQETVRHPTPAEIAQVQAEPGGYIVAFRSEADPSRLSLKNFSDEYHEHWSLLDEEYMSDPRIKDIRYISAVSLSPDERPQENTAKDGFAPPRSLQLAWDSSQEAPVAVIAKVGFRDQDSAVELLDEWENDGRIWFAEPNEYSELFQGSSTSSLFSNLQRDYQQTSVYHAQIVKTAEALGTMAQRDQTTGVTDQEILDNPPIIAVLDSGTDYTHPALADKIWTNPTPGASGCAGDIHGCDTTKATKGSLGNGDIFPFGTTGPGQSCSQGKECEHGTHVAGLLVADPTKGSGAGTCPVCQIMTIKVVQSIAGKGKVSDEAQIAGMNYLTRFRRGGGNAVRVINASFGKYSQTRAVSLLVSLLRRSGNGVLVVAAAGNEDSMGRTYPAAIADVVAVAALDDSGTKAAYSNFGPWVDLAAPGTNLVSTLPGGLSGQKPGTSMASPVVAGIAGLVVASKPNISFTELRQRLLRSGDPKIYGQDFMQGFNYNFYYVKIPGETIRRPLLGTGLVDAQVAVAGKDSGGLISPALDRVNPGCGTIGLGRNETTVEWGGAFLLMILPVFFVSLTGFLRFIYPRSGEL
jgi:subtilisin family serine protease